MSNTDMNKQNLDLDQFFTNPEIAKVCYKELCKVVPNKYRKLLIEPSAGDGSFFKLLPKGSKGFDLDPRCKGVVKKDWFKVMPADISMTADQVTIIGNPPFGASSNLAIKFLNHATTLAWTIGFIVPKTFRKHSVQRKISNEYHLLLDMDIPKNSFLIDGSAYDVPCVFQIWIRRSHLGLRLIPSAQKDNPVFDFCNKSDAILAIRRVGGRAGQIIPIWGASESSTLFIKPKDGYTVEQILSILERCDFSKIRENTAGVRSVSKNEINTVIMGVIYGEH